MINGAGAAGADDSRANERAPEPADDVEVTYRQPENRRETDDDGDAPREPQLVKDNARAALAAKFARRRSDNRAGVVPRSHVPQIDGDDPLDPNDPDYIASDDASSASEGVVDRQQQVEVNERAARAAPAVQAGATPFTLTVYGNQIHVRDRAELARYAEVDEDEAGEIPDATLIRLAQKQLAAAQRLDAAKEAEKRARTTGLAPSGKPAEEDDPSDQPEDTQPTSRRRKPAAETVEMVRELVYGDPEEAAARIEEMMDRGVTSRVQHIETSRSVDQIRRDVQTSMVSIGQANADLAAIPEAQDLISVKTTRAMVEELKKCGITDAEANELNSNPKLAAQAFIGAQSLPEYQGRLRRFDDIANEVVTSTRRVFGLEQRTSAPKPQQSAAPNVVPMTRRDVKRTLPQQPARAGAPLPTDLPMERTDDRSKRSSEAIERMRRARNQ